jgi:hypothetical protein
MGRGWQRLFRGTSGREENEQDEASVSHAAR